ncbi:MAG: hypothetical protein KGP29_06200 [Proteobacteria bacterium]|nr:hypothetical protein [Pseudomonadota bacterium]
MSKTPNKNSTVIVIGAGANADFRTRNNHSILAEIEPFSGKQLVRTPKESLQSIGMPTGEELVRKITSWEGEIIQNLYYGLCLEAAEKYPSPRMDAAKFAEHASTFLINNSDRSDRWFGNFTKSLDIPIKPQVFTEIGWNSQVTFFNPNPTIRKLENHQYFQWYHKISQSYLITILSALMSF